MQIISIVSAKGGSSKSLLSVNLFDYLKNQKDFKVMLIDTDMQKSSFNFLSNEDTVVFASTEKELIETLKAASQNQFDFVVIDTAPTITQLNKKIIEISDKILFTTKPAAFDVQSIYNSIDLLEQKEKGYLLLVQTINTSTKTKHNITEIQEIFKKEKINVINCTLSHSVAYINAINEAKTIFQTKYTKQKIEMAEIFAILLSR
ncbi:AAA family ATPase [[Haemophilus] felis]|nr:AAA family ATPase [[Haemophilus] felis]